MGRVRPRRGALDHPDTMREAWRKDIVPLPARAADLLKAMHPTRGHTKFGFLNRDDRRRAIADVVFWQILDVVSPAITHDAITSLKRFRRVLGFPGIDDGHTGRFKRSRIA